MEDEKWLVDSMEEVVLTDEMINGLCKEAIVSTEDSVMSFLPLRFRRKYLVFLPIHDGTNFIGGLIIGDRGVESFDDLERSLLLSLSCTLFLCLENMNISEELEEIKAHHEKITIQKETAEKLASLGTIAAGLAHEIKNPLVSIKTLAQLLPFRFDDKEFREHFTTIALNEVARLENIISDLLDFAKSSEPKFELMDLGNFIDEIIVILSSRFERKGIRVEKKMSGQSFLIYGDQAQLKQVFLNLFINSMEAMPDGGEITVELYRKDSDENVVLRIIDEGFGIRDEDKPYLFEPFFTTKGSGTGLGLSICKRIVERHRGEIFIESTYKKGTMVTVVFPIWTSNSHTTFNPVNVSTDQEEE